MLDLILAVACSTIIVLMFKYLEQKKLDNHPVITVNYIVCVIVGSIFFGFPSLKEASTAPWLPWALGLGTLFIGAFNLIAVTVQRCGVLVASVASKLTLVIPVLFAFFFFDEAATLPRITGIICALIAVILVSIPDRAEETAESARTDRLLLIALPFLVWLSGGGIEVSLKLNQTWYRDESSYPPFTVFLFGTAAALGLLLIIIRVLRGARLPGWHEIGAGIALGIPNYGSIYFLLRALDKYDAAVVFPVGNVGVIVGATALAYFFFEEKPSRWGMVGIAFALGAIILVLQ